MLQPEFKRLIFILWLSFPMAEAQQLVRMDLSVENVHANNDVSPVVKLTVDGEEVLCLIDTGSYESFLLWKTWVEKTGRKCEDLPYGCYECKPEPCKEGELETIEFSGDIVVKVFSHSVEFSLGEELSTNLNFGLVAGISPEETQPWASLGLMLSYDEEHKSILQQLSEEEIITENSFSIYLNSRTSHSGEVILGGEDPSKQASPLKFFKVVDESIHSVQLSGLQIGEDESYYIDIKDNAIFDTGSTGIFINKLWQGEIISFLQDAGKERVDIRVEDGVLLVSCKHVPNLPSMKFYVEELQGDRVPVEITSDALVWGTEGDQCILVIEFTDDDDDLVNLGLSAFFGNYYYFNIDEGKIGFTKVKQ